ncbi:MAG: hypothetical protein INR66_00430 [Gordonia polyisoprenivorans]|nr:hypothetical protein [Gordonia polyisoprenivorans]
MNPQTLAAQYEEVLGRLKRERTQLAEANLLRLEDEYQRAITALAALVDALHAHR